MLTGTSMLCTTLVSKAARVRLSILIKFIGHGPEHDMNNYAESVAKNLDVWLLLLQGVLQVRYN